MLNELERVVLTENIDAHHLKTGDIGTIVLVHGDAQGYEVEFATLAGETIAVVSVYAEQVRAVKSGEIAHARPIEPAA